MKTPMAAPWLAGPALAGLALAGLAVACGGGTPGPGAVAAPPVGGAAAPGRAAAEPNRFAGDRLWDDGRAEIDAYDATEMRYGAPRRFTAYHIVVKEDFSRPDLVKADPGHDPADLVTVLKLNQVIVLQTGIYSYHQMASCFFERSTMDLLKLSLASFEWCGNSFKVYTRRGDRATLHAHTYWDTMADVSYDLPAGPDLVLYDQLPLWVRSLPQTAGTTRTLRLVPGQISSQAPMPIVKDVPLRAVAEEEIEVPAGRYRALRWELRGGDGQPDVYWTGRDFPHLLVAWDKSDGGAYRLKWSQRLAYWMLHNPGDERYLIPSAPAAPIR